MSIVSLDDLNSLIPSDRAILKTHTEYSLAAAEFVAMVREAIGEDTPAAYIYDGVQRRIGISHVINEFYALQNERLLARGSTIDRGDSLTHLELQAADVVAQQSTFVYSNARRNPSRPLNFWSRSLMAGCSKDALLKTNIDSQYLQTRIASFRPRGVKILEKRPRLRFRRPRYSGLRQG